MEKLPAVAEYNEIRGLDPCLRHIVYLKPSALVRRRLDSRLSIREHIVQEACSYTHTVLIIHKVDKIEQPVFSLSCKSRDKDNGSIRHE